MSIPNCREIPGWMSAWQDIAAEPRIDLTDSRIGHLRAFPGLS